jgi:S1-C subfamily serine protease
MSAALSPTPLTSWSDALAALVAATAPSVVSVHSHRSRSSGFVWKPGFVITADEALADEGEVAVTLASGDRVPATIAGRDPTTDVALLRFDRTDVSPVSLQGVTPGAGALAVAVGARHGATLAAAGIVAAAGPAWRSMRGGEIDGRIELDVNLARPAEGGLVLDASGEAFGMAVFGPHRRVLVIPSRTIERVAKQIEAHGRVARGYLGLALQPVRLDREDGVGAIVMSVAADGPGAKAGIHQGDIIAAWNGKPIGNINAVLRALGPASVGQTAALSLRRGGATYDIDLVIGERPGEKPHA